MRKPVYGTLAAITAVAAFYSAGWHYRAYQLNNHISGFIKEIAESYGSQEANFSFSSSIVLGFPFRYHFHISNPRFTDRIAEKDIVLTSSDDFIIKTNSFGGNFEVTFPEKINLTSSHLDNQQALRIHFNHSPYIQMRLEKDSIPWLTSTPREPSSRHITYSDEGFIVVDAVSGEPIANTKKTLIQIQNKAYATASDLTNIVIRIKNVELDKLLSLTDTKLSLGKVNLSTELTMITPSSLSEIKIRESNLQIKGLDFSSQDFAFNLNGNITTSHNDIFPFGKLHIKLSDYKPLVDYLAAAINHKTNIAPLPMKTVSYQKKEGIKNFLAHIATHHHNDGTSIELYINRPQNGTLHIGNKGLTELIRLYYEDIQQSPKVPSSIAPSVG